MMRILAFLSLFWSTAYASCHEDWLGEYDVSRYDCQTTIGYNCQNKFYAATIEKACNGDDFLITLKFDSDNLKDVVFISNNNFYLGNYLYEQKVDTNSRGFQASFYRTDLSNNKRELRSQWILTDGDLLYKSKDLKQSYVLSR